MNRLETTNESALLRKYIRESLLLTEDEFSGVDASGFSSIGIGMGYGPMYADPGPLVKTFIEPFTDVFKTVVATAKEISVDAKVLLQVAFKVAISTIIPIVGQRYDKIFDDRDKKISQIRDQYRDVFERTEQALGGGDAKLIMFMANPAAFLAGAAALKAPAATKGLLSIATGGISDTALDGTKSGWDDLQRRILAGEKSSEVRRARVELEDDFLSSLSARIKSRRGLRGESSLRSHYVLREEKADKGKSDKSGGDYGKFLKDMLSSQKVVKTLNDMIKKNPKFKGMLDSLEKIEDETLKDAEQMSQNVLRNVNTFQDIEKLVAGNTKAKQALDKIKNIEDKKERDEAIKSLSINIKAASRQTFLATLVRRQKMFPKDSELSKKYQDAINKLKTV